MGRIRVSLQVLEAAIWLLWVVWVGGSVVTYAHASVGMSPRSVSETAVLRRIVDSRTIEVLYDGELRKVRLIGVGGTGPGLTAGGVHGHPLIPGEELRLVFDVQKSVGGTLLAYVYDKADGFVNGALLEHGRARLRLCPPNVTQLDPLALLQKKARREHLGLWRDVDAASSVKTDLDTAETAEVFDGLVIARLDVVREEVLIENLCDWRVDLSGWRLVSGVGTDQAFVFPDGTHIGAGERVVVASGPDAESGSASGEITTSGEDAGAARSREQRIRWTGRYVWNNRGDAALLLSPAGRALEVKVAP